MNLLLHAAPSLNRGDNPQIVEPVQQKHLNPDPDNYSSKTGCRSHWAPPVDP